MTFERIGVIAGTAISVGTVLGFLGYGLPWFPKADGAELKRIIQQQRHDTKQSAAFFTAQLLQNQADACDSRADVLRLEAKTDRSLALREMAEQASKRCEGFHADADKAQRALLK